MNTWTVSRFTPSNSIASAVAGESRISMNFWRSSGLQHTAARLPEIPKSTGFLTVMLLKSLPCVRNPSSHFSGSSTSAMTKTLVLAILPPVVEGVARGFAATMDNVLLGGRRGPLLLGSEALRFPACVFVAGIQLVRLPVAGHRSLLVPERYEAIAQAVVRVRRPGKLAHVPLEQRDGVDRPVQRQEPVS